jgi:predicted Fe-S protein YdhL (DUF1289 family)
VACDRLVAEGARWFRLDDDFRHVISKAMSQRDSAFAIYS